MGFLQYKICFWPQKRADRLLRSTEELLETLSAHSVQNKSLYFSSKEQVMIIELRMIFCQF